MTEHYKFVCFFGTLAAHFDKKLCPNGFACIRFEKKTSKQKFKKLK